MRAAVSIVSCSAWMSTRDRRSPIHRAWRLYRTLVRWNTLSRWLKRIRPDLVVTNTLTLPFGALAARSAGIPHVWYIHELGDEDHGLYFDLGQAVSLRLVDTLSQRIIVTSRTVQRHFEPSLPADKIRLIYPAVEVPERPLTPSDPATFKLVVVGAIAPGKRQEDAIRAVSLLVAKGLTVRLTVVGAGEAQHVAALRALVRELAVEHAVEFAGFSSDPYSYIAASDAALVCSRHEALGRVTIEAMKLGKPVIGANRGGTAELIRDGGNGLLYRAEDAEDLSRKVDTLYHSKDLRSEIGRSARAWAQETFGLARYTRALLDVFNEAAHAKRER
jgi:glycosyltransferase involved in cell wall biosynthesis